jgi:adenylate kinase family enzyme
MQRIVILGASGCGKTTLARALSKKLAVLHIEIDALHWGPNWTPVPADVRLARVQSAVAQPRWVVDGNYSPLRQTIWPRADTIVWLDYPLGLVMWRVLERSVRRAYTREALWAGNTESWRLTFCSKESILLWSLESWRKMRRDYPQVLNSSVCGHARRVRLCSRRETEEWVRNVARES